MKKLLILSLVSLFAASCSSIEDATSKYKTPEAPNAGLTEGEKSHYILEQDKSGESKLPSTDASTTTKKPAKKKKKTK